MAIEAEWFGTRIRWGAVISGFVVGMSVQLVLTLLGFAIGAWSIDLREADPAQGIPIGTGIWAAISMLTAAFTGGYVTAYLAGSSLRADGLFHGAVVWGLTWLVSAWLTTTAMAMLFGGIFSAFGEGLKAVGSGVGTVVSKVADRGMTGQMNLSQFGLSKEELRQQVESTLQATGKPELQPGQIKQEAERTTAQTQRGQSPKQLSDTAITELYDKLAALDEQAAINVMVNKLGMSETQAQEVVRSLTGTLSQVKQKAQAVKEQSVDVANTTLKRMAAAAWWLFILAILTLATTMFGAAVGTAAEARYVERTRLRGRREAV
jgi:hypothetical protein